jgi:hypothetical protein
MKLKIGCKGNEVKCKIVQITKFHTGLPGTICNPLTFNLQKIKTKTSEFAVITYKYILQDV